ncbi:MAG: hypothetical protein QXU20_00390 [Candidatus Woesearchaeota archaeon]
MVNVLPIEQVILFIILATLAAIVYSLRLLFVMERRVARIESNIEKLVFKLLKEEEEVIKEEEEIKEEIEKKILKKKK